MRQVLIRISELSWLDISIGDPVGKAWELSGRSLRTVNCISYFACFKSLCQTRYGCLDFEVQEHNSIPLEHIGSFIYAIELYLYNSKR